MKQVFKRILLSFLFITLSYCSYAQNITQIEYFFDSDPGFGNGTQVTVTPSTNIVALAFSANVAPLANGMHTLFVRSKDANGVWGITNNMSIAKVQPVFPNPNTVTNIVKLEYFYDNDPGFGLGTDVPVTPATNISGFLFNPNVASLAGGMHTLFIRTKDASGLWSITNNYSFAKVQPVFPNAGPAGNIVKLEYFFDTDPGFGSGIDVPITPALNINGFVFNPSVSSLASGLHTLFIRTKDVQGNWSITNNLQFAKLQGVNPNPHIITNITKAEYFYDNDPGFGNGTNIPVVPATDISSMIFNADVSAIAMGMHTLFVRTRDAQGQWSITNNYSFAKVQPVFTNPNLVSNIDKAEYYYDTDPGYGNGTNIPVVAATDIPALLFNANVASLAGGAHTLYVRTRDVQGKWSVVNNLVFAKVQGLFTNPHTLSNVTNIEYFVDTDPGFGNGNQVPITPALDIVNATFNVDMTVLVNAPHHLYVRSRSAQGKWSITYVHAFVGGTAPLAIKLVSFDAILQKNNSVKLQWITEMEKDVEKYTIERSHDASNWTYVGGKTPLSNSSTERRAYELVDDNAGKGIVYYRLTEVDKNGNKTLAPIRFVNISSQEANYTSVYPNPSDGKQVNIATDMFAAGEVLVTIVDAEGKLHLREVVKAQPSKLWTISGLNLAAGNYFINLQGKERAESLKLQIRGSNP